VDGRQYITCVRPTPEQASNVLHTIWLHAHISEQPITNKGVISAIRPRQGQLSTRCTGEGRFRPGMAHRLAELMFRGMFTRPAVIVLQSGLSHTNHHRSQPSVYLRSMSAKVLSIYGEGFDARERAQQTSV
jgi:hypothetical protein